MTKHKDLIEKINKLNARYQHSHMATRARIKPEFHYQRGNPAGYTDDLGIIADRDQWVEEQPSGWRSQIDPRDAVEMIKWCEKNLKGKWETGINHILISDERDVNWFMLRWSS